MIPTLPAFAEELRLPVRHDHGIRSYRGELVFRDDRVEYLTLPKEDAQTWKYVDMQQLGLKSDRRISVVTYEDRKLQLGKDTIFNFELTEGRIPASLAEALQSRFVAEFSPSCKNLGEDLVFSRPFESPKREQGSVSIPSLTLRAFCQWYRRISRAAAPG